MENNNFIENIKDVDINSEMKKSYIEYAMSVIVSRALPDVRDGLKPVQRRIVYAMGELGLHYNQKYKKSAKIVGDVISNFHPHGDSSIYSAMVRMAQTFSLRYPLVDGQGNFGSIDGDGAAAMRYTEARMSRLTAELLKDIKKETVDFRPNFDNESLEPTVLPSRIPNLLMNGSNGIAVGMATSIPPHNLGELIDAIIAMIENENIEVEDLIQYLKGPDFPTGATIMGMNGFIRGYKTGRGRVVIRSKYNIEEHKNGKTSIIVTEIPYQVNKAKLLQSIADLVKSKKIDGITDLRDESNREGIRIVIELRRDVNPQILVNQLYKNTPLESSFSMNMIALVNGEPKLLNLREMIYYYIEHQKEVETRRVQFDLNKARARAHILEGYKIAIDNIDEVIKIIRESYDNAIEKLMERFKISEIQAKAIGDMRIIRLQGLERDKIEQEYRELQELIKELVAVLEDETLLMQIIKTNLIEIKDKNNDNRRTEVEMDYSEIDIEDMIDEEQVTITLTQHGYVKRVPTEIYNIQNRGGRGKSGLSTKEEDYVVDIFNTSTHDTLMIFTNFGKVYSLKAYQIPEGSRTSKGNAIINLISIDQGERVKTVMPVSNFEDGYLIMLTKKGIVKRTHISEYKNIRKNGIIAMNLQESDELVGVCLTKGKNDLIIITNNGQAIRIDENDVRSTARNTQGVIGIKLRENDSVVSLCNINPEISDDENINLLVMSENGFAKRTKLSEYKNQNRGGIGNKTYKITSKTGNLVGATVVEDDNEIIMINSNGVIIRILVNSVSIYSRVSMGVRVMKLEDDEKIIAFAKIVDVDNEEEDIEE